MSVRPVQPLVLVWDALVEINNPFGNPGRVARRRGERERLLSTFEGKKRSDQLLQIAIHDLESSYDKSPELSTVLGLLDSTLSSDRKSD